MYFSICSYFQLIWLSLFDFFRSMQFAREDDIEMVVIKKNYFEFIKCIYIVSALYLSLKGISGENMISSSSLFCSTIYQQPCLKFRHDFN